MSLIDGNTAFSDTDPAGFPADSKPHEVISKLCGNIERYALGLEAKKLLALPRAERRGRGLVILPMWGWGEPKHSVGRKEIPFTLEGAVADNTTKLLMPIRNVWEAGHLNLVTESQIISGRLVGSGHSGVIQTRVVVTPGHMAAAFVEQGEFMAMVSTSAGAKVDQVLNKIARDGDIAYWDMFRHWDNIIRRILDRASVGLIRELEDFHKDDIGFNPFDAACLDKIRDTILLGFADEETHLVKESRLSHYLNQAATNPDLFLNVEPQRFLNKNLTRDCTEALRREMGDPHIGPKVRRFKMDHPELESIDQVIRAYNEEFPKDRLAIDRATIALGIGRDLAQMGRMVPLADHRDFSNVVDSAEDQAIDGWATR